MGQIVLYTVGWILIVANVACAVLQATLWPDPLAAVGLINLAIAGQLLFSVLTFEWF
jgi:hypothetical protein